MLFYVVFYVLSSVLVFQGVQQLMELREPMGVLPQEVVQRRDVHSFWGWGLVCLGLLGLGLALLSHVQPGARPLLRVLLWVELSAVALFGISLVFLGRKVEYVGKPTASHGDHGHP
ncbi:MAG: hypothetical protein HY823_06625 [Acidobacteria bacterium]|nr:hypothetical protein [Acidobacteriota bacterium]